MPTRNELFDTLRSMELPMGEYAVFGSGPLLVRGLIDEASDLDVICRGAAWEKARRLGDLVDLEEGVEVVSARGGMITFGRSWAYGDFDMDDLIDSAETIDGLPFVRIEHVIAFKRAADRPKDRAHLRLIERGPNSDWTPRQRP